MPNNQEKGIELFIKLIATIIKILSVTYVIMSMTHYASLPIVFILRKVIELQLFKTENILYYYGYIEMPYTVILLILSITVTFFRYRIEEEKAIFHFANFLAIYFLHCEWEEPEFSVLFIIKSIFAFYTAVYFIGSTFKALIKISILKKRLSERVKSMRNSKKDFKTVSSYSK